MGGTGAAPGWYPDPTRPGFQRYWDGAQWIESDGKVFKAGWYPDPHRPGYQRYFDGSEWTDKYLDPAGVAESVEPKKRRTWVKVLVVLVVLGAIGSALNSGETDSGPSAAPSSTDDLDSSAPSGASSGDSSEPATPSAPESTLTLGQENAIRSAENYLEFQAFSRSGLIDQLEFEGYAKADAEFAVDYLKVDWKAQAAKSAESYLEFQSFSRDGLINQLEFEGYTREEAEYGVGQVGY